LVEDSLPIQGAVATGLRKTGYAVDVTGDGQEGLWLAESNDYDVIIPDIMLPGLDGLSLLQRLRSAKKGTHVLLLSVWLMSNTRWREVFAWLGAGSQLAC
jgi:DNA-binding response OmpR family regulator